MYLVNKSHTFMIRDLQRFIATATQWTFVALVSLFSCTTMASGKEELEGISIQGNNEQPQVLYLIPWQSPSIPAREEHPPVKQLSGVLAPVDPEFHENELFFRKTQSLHTNLQRKSP
ncbi:MAG: hypothetical protein H7A00_09230 [Hahellaceae bacterium]|nr:hypothetical protein [Hahellaceae bacterium]